MNSVKVLCTALSASAIIHAAFLGYSLILPGHESQTANNELVRIEEFQLEKAPVSPSLPVVPKKEIVTPKKTKPAPRHEKKAMPQRSFSEFQRMMEEKIQKQLQELKQMEAPPEPPSPAVSAMTSAELLNDPVKGKVFLSYFSRVKKKIQDTVYQKTAHDLYGQGSVSLVFVLNAEGKLEKVRILSKETQADEMMQALAVKCLRESAPFGPFPKDLGSSRVAFNITIFFDGGR